MKTMRYNKAKTLGAIKKNRDAHRELFLKAQEVYREDVIEELDAMLDAARSGSKIRTVVALEAPQDMTAHYDRIISMLEMSEDTEVEISETEFAQYILDDWSWKTAVTALNASYASKAR